MAVALVKADQLTARPAVVGLHEVIGHLVVADRHERLYPVGAAAVEDAVIEGEPGLVGRLVVAVGKDPRPGDREAEHIEAHLGEKRDVLLIVVVEVDAVVVGIKPVGVDRARYLAGRVACAPEKVVVHARAAAVDVPSPFELVGCRRSPPIEAVGKCCCHVCLLP